MSGEEASATFPATVYEPGVLFLRPTLFRRLVRTFAGEKFFTFQVTQEGLLFGDVRVPFEKSDMVYYPNPDDAPDQWLPPPAGRREHPRENRADAVSYARGGIGTKDDGDRSGSLPKERVRIENNPTNVEVITAWIRLP